ncbi:hypothetical protein ACOMHN_057549 [Nucella lapillus]
MEANIRSWLLSSVILFVVQLPFSSPSKTENLNGTFLQIKHFWVDNNCVFPFLRDYEPNLLTGNFTLKTCSAAEELPSKSIDPLLRFLGSQLCSLLFELSKKICQTPEKEVLKPAEQRIVHLTNDGKWDVCNRTSTELATYNNSAFLREIREDKNVCEKVCVQNKKTAPVCRLLVAALLEYEAYRKYGRGKGEVNARPTPEGNSRPTPEDNANPTPEGNTRPTPKGNSRPTPEDNANPTPEGNTRPTPEDNANPTPEGNTRPTPKGNVRPTPEDNTRPTPKGNVRPTPEDNTRPTPKGNVRPTPEGNTRPTPKGNVRPTPEGNTRPTPKGNVRQTPEDNARPTPKGNVRPTPEGNTNPTPEDNARPTPEDNANPTPEDNTRPTPEDNTNPTPEDNTRPTPEDNTNPTPEGKGKNGTQTPHEASAGSPSSSAGEGEEVKVDLMEDERSGSSGYFMAYLVTALVLGVAAYVLYHNRRKIMGYIVESNQPSDERQRPSDTTRSGSKVKYSKLKTSTEEILPSFDRSITTRNYIY